jgi:hypothetical protein
MTVRKTSESGSGSYPAWVCFDCGEKYGRRPVGVATWHEGTCGVCRSPGVLVTEPRDFGHLPGRKRAREGKAQAHDDEGRARACRALGTAALRGLRCAWAKRGA